jgi:hypothetical protein
MSQDINYWRGDSMDYQGDSIMEQSMAPGKGGLLVPEVVARLSVPAINSIEGIFGDKNFWR